MRVKQRKTEKAREFLEQIEKIDIYINNLMEEQSRWKTIAYGISSPTMGERVQASSNPTKRENAICKYSDLEREINAEIDKLYDTRRRVNEILKGLKKEECAVLHERYIQYMSWDDIAKKHDKTKSWATTIRNRGITHVQEILDAQKRGMNVL